MFGPRVALPSVGEIGMISAKISRKGYLDISQAEQVKQVATSHERDAFVKRSDDAMSSRFCMTQYSRNAIHAWEN
jgi:hypothetical protein